MNLDSVKALKAFLNKNERLVDDIKDAAGEGADRWKALSKRLETNQKETEAMLKKLGQMKFAIGKDADTVKQQRKLLKAIGTATRKIAKYRDTNANLTKQFRQERAGLYTQLARTYAGSVAKVVRFTKEEKAKLTALMNKAVLDTEKRKNHAAILGGAVALTKLALKVVNKIVA